LTDEVTLELERMDEFRELLPDLRVIARATAHDKYLLIVGLQAAGKSVAMTGEGVNDEDALKRADVGIALNSGCSLARKSADVVLTNDDLNSVVKAVMWGRNLKSNISRFLQF
jgi:magnesium-transporting ATPase (P-type)